MNLNYISRDTPKQTSNFAMYHELCIITESISPTKPQNDSCPRPVSFTEANSTDCTGLYLPHLAPAETQLCTPVEQKKKQKTQSFFQPSVPSSTSTRRYRQRGKKKTEGEAVFRSFLWKPSLQRGKEGCLSQGAPAEQKEGIMWSAALQGLGPGNSESAAAS